MVLYASYVNTKGNRADIESRKTNPDTEWELSPRAFQTVITRYRRPKMDFYTSTIFVSQVQEPDAFAADAFILNWGSYRIFLRIPTLLFIIEMHTQNY